jgi:uncharacterized protein
MKIAEVKPQNRDFIRVGRSRIAGKGVFAKRKIPKGTRIIEYLGLRVPVSKFLVEISQGKAPSIYAFRLNESFLIDGAVGGNEARFINHSCEPNCEAYVFDDRAYIYAMRDISRGEELTFDYQLQRTIKSRISKHDKELYRCLCGSPNCRGSMIAPVRKPQKH